MRTHVLDELVKIVRFVYDKGVFDVSDSNKQDFLDENDKNIISSIKTVEISSLSDSELKDLIADLKSAERIIIDAGFWRLSAWQSQRSAAILSALLPFQQKIKILLPVFQLPSLMVEGEIPFWQQAGNTQTQTILYFSKTLPESSFIFISNLQHSNNYYLALFFQLIQQNLLFSLDTNWGLLSFDQVLQIVLKEILRPNDGSVIIQSSQHLGSKIFAEADWLYKQRYGQKHQLQTVRVQNQSIIPFQCRVVEKQLDFSQLVREVFQNIPSPNFSANDFIDAEKLKTIFPIPTQQKKIIQQSKPSQPGNQSPLYSPGINSLVQNQSAHIDYSSEKHQYQFDNIQASSHPISDFENSGSQTFKQASVGFSPEYSSNNSTFPEHSFGENDDTSANHQTKSLGYDSRSDETYRTSRLQTDQIKNLDKTNHSTSSPQLINASLVTNPSAEDFVQNIQLYDQNSPIIVNLQEDPEEQKNKQLSADVQRIFRSQITGEASNYSQKKATVRKKIKRTSKKRTAMFYVGLLFMSVGIGISMLLGSFYLSTQLTTQKYEQVIKDSQISTREVAVRWDNLKSYLAILRPQYHLFDLIFALPVVDTAREVLEKSSALEELEKITALRNQELFLVFNSLWNNSDGISGKNVENLLSVVEKQDISWKKLFGSVEGASDPLIQDSQPQTGGESKNAHQLIQVLPKIFGEQQSKSYVLVFQNSQELRPTGGFIEAIAVLTFYQGSLQEVQTFSSYQLDSLMSKPITPPSDLVKYLGEQQWWLRDANWHPDGVLSSQKISEFVEDSLQKKPDGIITLNSSALPQILSAVGPVSLPDFDEVLTEKNIAERLEFHTELPQQVIEKKIEYRSAILTAIIQKLATLNEQQVPLFIEAFKQMLDERKIIVYSSAEEIQGVFSTLGWVGSLAFPSCPQNFIQEGCDLDGFAHVETNIGVNRANAHIQRSQTHQIKIVDNKVIHTHKVVLTNTAQNQAWPKGDYQVYVRQYMPRTIKNVQVKIDDRLLPNQDLRRNTTSQLEEIGFSTVVPIKNSTTVITTYETDIYSKNNSTYVFFQARQLGLDSPLPSVEIEFSPSLHVKTISPKPASLDNPIIFNQENSPIRLILLQFGQEN